MWTEQNINAKIVAALNKRDGQPEEACDLAVGVLNAYDIDDLAPFTRRRLLLAMMENGEQLQEELDRFYKAKKIALLPKREAYVDTCAEHYYRCVSETAHTQEYKDWLYSGIAGLSAFAVQDSAWSNMTLRERISHCNKAILAIRQKLDPDNLMESYKDGRTYVESSIHPSLYGGGAQLSYIGETRMITFKGYVHVMRGLPGKKREADSLSSAYLLKHIKTNIGYDRILDCKPDAAGHFSIDPKHIRKEHRIRDDYYIGMSEIGSCFKALSGIVHENVHAMQNASMRFYKEHPELAQEKFGMSEWDYRLGLISRISYRRQRGKKDYRANMEEVLAFGGERYFENSFLPAKPETASPT